MQSPKTIIDPRLWAGGRFRKCMPVLKEGPVLLLKDLPWGKSDAFKWSDFAWGKWRDKMGNFKFIFYYLEGCASRSGYRRKIWVFLDSTSVGWSRLHECDKHVYTNVMNTFTRVWWTRLHECVLKRNVFISMKLNKRFLSIRHFYNDLFVTAPSTWK